MATALPALAVEPQPTQQKKGSSRMAMTLSTTAFAPNQPIPAKHTCDGSDSSPALSWGTSPSGTKTLALIMDDPDAPGGTWVHWVIYNIPAGATGLPENAPKTATLPDGSLQGKNSWPKLGYGGPCPPSGTHRYYFKLFALDTTLNLPTGATKEQLLAAMEGHVLAKAELMGTYARK
jgi:Raf kinase inhibitor-like YbhB/YbcL family protein